LKFDALTSTSPESAALHSIAQFEPAHPFQSAVLVSHVGLVGLWARHASRHAVSEQSHWSEHASTAMHEAVSAAYSEAHLLVAQPRHTVLLGPVAGGFRHQGALGVLPPLPLPEHAARASPAQVARNADESHLRRPIVSVLALFVLAVLVAVMIVPIVISVVVPIVVTLHINLTRRLPHEAAGDR
jgi:hypothetical protein